MKRGWIWVWILSVAFGLLTGCGGSGSTGQQHFGEGSQAPVTTDLGGGGIGNQRHLVITEKIPISDAEGTVDTIELEAFDANGVRVFGPNRVPLAATMDFADFPAGARYLQIDYLRNGGFMLFRAEPTLADGQRVLENPSEQATTPQTTTFTVNQGPEGFDWRRTTGGAPINWTLQKDSTAKASPVTFELKGVCYSPTPIGDSNRNGPAFGDVFWDTFEASPGNNIYNWYALWGSGALGDTGFNARDDISRIRAMGCNAIRTYSFISRQIGSNGSVPAPGAGQHFTHQQFLDRCWNNGQDPIYVIVGIPVPEGVLYRYLQKSNEIAFWEYVVKETAADVKDHPAVIGFTIHNEIDEDRSAFPAGGANEDSNYYYGELKKLADTIKAVAPGKLVGWAAHDAPPHVVFGGSQPSPGPSYFEQLTSIDFFGVNTYQTVNFSSITGDGSGSFARLTGAARKPVIFTEIGWPATGHRDPNNSDSIYEDETTRQKTADKIAQMLPMALKDPLVAGTFYFEYCDEWWKQPGKSIIEWNGTVALPTSFPNGYWDEEGFGLFSIAPGPGRKPGDPTWAGSGPSLPVDTQTERKAMTGALRSSYTDAGK